jgi:hypothetical protein
MRKIFVVFGFFAVIVCAFFASKAWSTFQANARTAKFNQEVDNLFTGLQKYRERVGSYPTGGNATVAKALSGENNKNVIILVGQKTELSDKGEYVDPWGTPLKIYFSDSGVLIRSAGPNRRFDDSSVTEADDYIRSN